MSLSEVLAFFLLSEGLAIELFSSELVVNIKSHHGINL